MIHSFPVRSSQQEELIDITADVQNSLKESPITSGICYIYTPHTTAAITINENADPSVTRDILKGLSSLGLERLNFSHMEGNSSAHIKSSMVGCSALVFVEHGKLQLGTWQGIFFCEFDGPRSRTVTVKLV